MWDQKIGMKELGVVVHGEWEVKVRPLFTEGTGKKKEQGKSLWSDEGMKYFQRAEKHGERYIRTKKHERDLWWI